MLENVCNQLKRAIQDRGWLLVDLVDCELAERSDDELAYPTSDIIVLWFQGYKINEQDKYVSIICKKSIERKWLLTSYQQAIFACQL
jgi:hypothetical protein